MQSICMLGRQPKLSLAELEACFGAAKVQPIGTQAALVDIPHQQIVAAHLGGTIKIAKLLTSLQTTAWDKLNTYCKEALPEFVADFPEGKLQLGLSVYGLPMRAQTLQRTGLEYKKIIRATGRSVRVTPNQEPALSSAQVLHNRLTGPMGLELLFIADGNTTYIAQTTHVQDIDDYARRDYGRPKRSGFVGMLPPKLAQMMLHFAQVVPDSTVLDPFCGTGVVLQEAILLGAKAYGTDVEPKMIDFSLVNLEWLVDMYHLSGVTPRLEAADARHATWHAPIDLVVCETYLGQPMTDLPTPDKFERIRQDCNNLITAFLQNLHPQIAPGTRCTVAVPAWRSNREFIHLPLVDQIADLGYNRVSFEHANDRDLIYHREDQIVARELLVLTRK